MPSSGHKSNTGSNMTISKDNSFGGRKAVGKYLVALDARQAKYPFDPSPSTIADSIKEKGYCVCTNAISKYIIETLRGAMNRVLQINTQLKSRDKYFAAIQDPLYTVPLCFDIATSEFLDTVATAYFECKPAIGTTNLRKSYVNKLPNKDTLLYHSDRNSIKFLKFFFYLNNVDLDGGPFTYVEGIHAQKFKKWDQKYRWQDEEIEGTYGKESVKYLTGCAGDIIVADPTGFHKGSKPLKTNRMMFTVNYVIHPEGWKKPQEPIRESQSMLKEKAHLADFLVRKN